MTDGARGESEAADRPIPLHSAGGVVFRRQAGAPSLALMRSGYGTWVLPKGGVEKGEPAEEGARREVGEEIGLTALVSHGPLGWTEHEFDREGRRYRKRVDWFLFEAAGDSEPRADPAENALDCGWFEAAAALRLLSHADQKRILRRALERVGATE